MHYRQFRISAYLINKRISLFSVPSLMRTVVKLNNGKNLESVITYNIIKMLARNFVQCNELNALIDATPDVHNIRYSYLAKDAKVVAKLLAQQEIEFRLGLSKKEINFHIREI